MRSRRRGQKANEEGREKKNIRFDPHQHIYTCDQHVSCLFALTDVSYHHVTATQGTPDEALQQTQLSARPLKTHLFTPQIDAALNLTFSALDTCNE